MRQFNIHIKFFSSLGLSIRKSEFTPPFNEIWSHAWDIVMFFMYIQITWYTDNEYARILKIQREKKEQENNKSNIL